jgi:uncharacterized membrane protein
MIRAALSHYGLIFHVAAGMIGFFVAPGALLTVKGGLWHRRWGKVYFWAMAAAALSAMLLSSFGVRVNPFLTLVGVLSFYTAYSGYRVLYQKRPTKEQGPKFYDWIVALITAAAGCAFIVLGVLKPTPLWVALSTVAIIFGVICVVMGAQDLVRFLRPSTDKNFWWYEHMGRMLGSYIAANTAFLVNNARHLHLGLPAWFWWLLPSAIGFPAIAIWVAYYKRKFNAHRNLPAAAKPAHVLGH